MLSLIKSYVIHIYYFIFDRYILYPLMTVLPRKFDIKFMNLGYATRPYGVNKGQRHTSISENTKIMGILNEAIEPDDAIRAHIYLYEKSLSLCPVYPYLEEFRVAEVGCGLGGGIHWIKRAHPEIKSIIGIDKVVANPMNNQIIQGVAENLPLPTASMDLIINIESSHLYDSTPNFFSEVCRVLKPGGYFCWADIRFRVEMPVVLDQATSAGLDLVEYENITSGVLNGIEYTARKYDKLFDKIPWIFKLLRGSIRTTYCAPGTYTYNRLVRREKIYATAFKFNCLNGGTVRGNECECPFKYSGKHCQREKHCRGYERNTNGSCIECKTGYQGSDCDQRECKNEGQQEPDGSCKCKLPYSGEFCDKLTTSDVYLYYNRMIYRFGPIGAFVIIPMIIINYGCTRLSQKRQIERVERSFGEQTKTDISKHVIENLLKQ
ncbi:hypothetical protein FO519_000297 [Halicephalobus sp. NKZ332]|nr:hypothetical protein FO519_000297 [Halicephalobus sp. NKZ332]